MKCLARWTWFACAAALLAAGGGALAFEKSQPRSKAAAPQASDAQPFDDKWPKDVETFLQGHYVDRADVVLTRRTGDITAAVIRWATNSPFSHAALVFTGPQFDSGISGTFVIESGNQRRRPDEIHRLHLQPQHLRRHQAPEEGLVQRRRAKSRVRGLLLDKIKDTYDYWTIWRIARNIWFGVQAKVRTKERTVRRLPPAGLVRRPTNTSVRAWSRSASSKWPSKPSSAANSRQKSCAKSSFTRVPRAACRRAGTFKDLGADAKDTAINFRDILSDELFSVTPEDLAPSPTSSSGCTSSRAAKCTRSRVTPKF